MDDDDMIVVIVGDDYPEQESGPIKIKEEAKEVDAQDFNSDPECEDDNVENLIATVKKHGKLIPLFEAEKEPGEVVDYDGDDLIDEDYVPEEGELVDFEDDEPEPEPRRPTKVSYKNRPQKSYVQELIKSNPELEDDNELLTWTIVQIMWDTKRPEAPDFVFSFNSDDMLYECSHCGVTTESCPAAERHYQEKHGPRYLVCLACGADFRSTTNLYKHEKRCMSDDIEIVLRARALSLGKKGKSRPFLPKERDVEMLRSVRQNAIKETSFPCTSCSAVFTSKSTLRAHVFHHNGVRPYQCPHCVSAYTSASGLSRHMKHHTSAEFICDTCGRSFKIKQALISHLDTHLPLRKHECILCGRRFAQKMALKLHVDRKHYNLPPPCACQLCPKRYPRMSVLKNHMLREHGMVLMTRKMFFKKLPTLTNDQVEQAKVVFNASDACVYEPGRKDFDGGVVLAYENPQKELEIEEVPFNESDNVYIDEESQDQDQQDAEYYEQEVTTHNEQKQGNVVLKQEINDDEYHIVLNNSEMEQVTLTQADLEANADLAKQFLLLVKATEETQEKNVKYIVVKDGEFVTADDNVTEGNNNYTVEVSVSENGDKTDDETPIQDDNTTEGVNMIEYESVNEEESQQETEDDTENVSQDIPVGNDTLIESNEGLNKIEPEQVSESNLANAEVTKTSDDTDDVDPDVINVRQSRRVKRKTTKILESAMSNNAKVRKVSFGRANILSKKSR